MIYKNTKMSLSLAGPSNLEELVRYAKDRIQSNHKYHIFRLFRLATRKMMNFIQKHFSTEECFCLVQQVPRKLNLKRKENR